MLYTNPQFSNKTDIQGLIQAFVLNHGEDALSSKVSPAQWEALAAYMQPFTLAQSQVLIKQGASDRTLYFVESGNLSVHFEDENDRIRLALVGAGSVLGEGGFFSNMPRNATVQAATDCKMWGISPNRFAELSQRLPGPALALTIALGAIVCKRMQDRRRRIAIT
jgi:CRP/FNR family transcriptional regulator, cyclic AMP receptor protein